MQGDNTYPALGLKHISRYVSGRKNMPPGVSRGGHPGAKNVNNCPFLNFPMLPKLNPVNPHRLCVVSGQPDSRSVAGFGGSTER